MVVEKYTENVPPRHIFAISIPAEQGAGQSEWKKDDPGGKLTSAFIQN